VSAGPADALDVLRTRFRHDAFRPGQAEVIRSLLEGRDVLAVLPTGAGKSITYEVTSQLLPGLTVVVSPLLALMRDQLRSLDAVGVAAGALNSAQSHTENDRALARAGSGQLKLLFLTPERLEDAAVLDALNRAPVSLCVVDEAHSISEWGRNFRAAYLNLAVAIEQLGQPTLLALTATATPWVRRDIIDRLGMRDPRLVVRDTDRPNLFLEVIRVEEEREHKVVLQKLFGGHLDDDAASDPLSGVGIVYTATTHEAEQVAEWLVQWGIAADYYHGRRPKHERDQVQAAFMSGDIRVIAATNAFGLGIDKRDVRFVVHRDMPSSVEAYYQEAGRAGRDGESARCILIYHVGDIGRAAFLAGGGELKREDIVRGREGLLRQRTGTRDELQAATGLSQGKLLRLLELLQEERIVQEHDGVYQLAVDDFDPDGVSLEQEAARHAYERSRLEMMRAYAELRDCRRRYILNYFGEDPDWQRCGRCDVDRLHTSAAPAPADGPFAVNDQVRHVSLGIGVVERVTEDTVSVLFEKSGYKTLSLELVLQQHLLERTAPHPEGPV
jgi:ATP-dependent DNA helicase RecQ